MSDKKTFNQKVAEIQQKIKVGKNRVNKFGGYNYRSTEDILEGIKPLLGDLTLTINEEMIVLGDHGGPGVTARFYKKVVATLSDGENSLSASSMTREDDSQKGMTQAQLSGSVSSYGAKMALRGLALLDDTQDDDATNDHGKGGKAEETAETKQGSKTEESKSSSVAKEQKGFRNKGKNVKTVKPEASISAPGGDDNNGGDDI